MGDGYIELPDWLTPAGPAHPSPGGGEEPATLELVLPDGRRIAITGPVLVGRDPEPRAGEVAALVVSGPDRSVSKTHALFRPSVDGGAILIDRRSTNGTAILGPDGERRSIQPESPTTVRSGDRIALGEVVILVERRGR